MHGLDMLMTAKHYLGAALLVGHWPSRRMIRRLTEENAELRDLRDHVETSAGYLASCVERSRTYS